MRQLTDIQIERIQQVVYWQMVKHAVWVAGDMVFKLRHSKKPLPRDFDIKIEVTATIVDKSKS